MRVRGAFLFIICSSIAFFLPPDFYAEMLRDNARRKRLPTNVGQKQDGQQPAGWKTDADQD